ncbi:hypothetical protein Patl1_15022 [Pistacia atlantica]|uniref:Uncharacterized protein n=1 Tax=Pistacia atlantica TaxID=434234 RepID=A0ACC1B5W3_9ROSI|nr:hypothetical protein Patl1_15022 [Pistacia atlantica]
MELMGSTITGGGPWQAQPNSEVVYHSIIFQKRLRWRFSSKRSVLPPCLSVQLPPPPSLFFEPLAFTRCQIILVSRLPSGISTTLLILFK